MSKRITPFPNLSEFFDWRSNNCAECCRYSDASEKRCNARCKLAFDLDIASVTDGEISLKTAENIGLEEGYLKSKCNDFNKPIIRKKYPKKDIKQQTNLFSHE